MVAFRPVSGKLYRPSTGAAFPSIRTVTRTNYRWMARSLCRTQTISHSSRWAYRQATNQTQRRFTRKANKLVWRGRPRPLLRHGLHRISGTMFGDDRNALAPNPSRRVRVLEGV